VPTGAGVFHAPERQDLFGPLSVTFTPSGTIQSLNGGVTQTGTPNAQPSQVTGIAVIRAAQHDTRIHIRPKKRSQEIGFLL
jgi:hypothetical protein